MKKHQADSNILLLSLLTALAVGSINTSCALIAYRSFMSREHVAAVEPLISNDSVVETSLASAETDGATEENLSLPNSPGQPAKKPRAPAVAGQKPQPLTTTLPDGTTKKRWCSGVNPALEDEVCKAILSIAADPSATNPHLGEKARKSLSLLPKDSTLTMDESSWKPTSSTAGTMLVTVHTSAYGDVKLKVLMEKVNGIWMVNDGQLV